LFVLPESLPSDRRKIVPWRRANPIGAMKLLRSHPQLVSFGVMHFLYNLAHQVLPSVFVLYAAYRYGWGPKMVGVTLAIIGVSVAIVQGALIGPIVKRFGERRAMLTGMLSGAAGLIVYGLASTGWMFMLGTPVMALWGLYGPAAQGLMTRRVSHSEQGQLQGALASVLGITGLLGPGLFTVTFATFISARRHVPIAGAPFLLASLLLMTAAVIGYRATMPAYDAASSPA
jgi:DHA1 family tetracycline resistance protein-like MFS transporter